jgi:hypothetical protein
MTKAKTNSLDKYMSPIPNNPRDNQLYVDKKEKRDEDKFNRERMLFDKAEDALSRIISKREPSEPRKTEYLKVDKKQFAKDLEFWKKRNQQASARERLKRKGAVPIKKTTGGKLFEDFMSDMREATGTNKQQNIDNAELRNIYNAATQLDYRRWLIWITDEYSSLI